MEGRRNRGHRAESSQDGSTLFTQLWNTCSMTGSTAACLKLSGCFRVVTMNCGCASRASGIRLIKTLGSRVTRRVLTGIQDA